MHHNGEESLKGRKSHLQQLGAWAAAVREQPGRNEKGCSKEIKRVSWAGRVRFGSCLKRLTGELRCSGHRLPRKLHCPSETARGGRPGSVKGVWLRHWTESAKSEDG